MMDYGVTILATRFLLARREAATMQAENANNEKSRRHWLKLVKACERELKKRGVQ